MCKKKPRNKWKIKEMQQSWNPVSGKWMTEHGEHAGLTLPAWQCCGLNINCPHSLMGLNSWSMVGGVLFWKAKASLGGGALVGEVYDGAGRLIAWLDFLFFPSTWMPMQCDQPTFWSYHDALFACCNGFPTMVDSIPLKYKPNKPFLPQVVLCRCLPQHQESEKNWVQAVLDSLWQGRERWLWLLNVYSSSSGSGGNSAIHGMVAVWDWWSVGEC